MTDLLSAYRAELRRLYGDDYSRGVRLKWIDDYVHIRTPGMSKERDVIFNVEQLEGMLEELRRRRGPGERKGGRLR